MIVVCTPISLGSRSMARSTVSTVISSLETQHSFPTDLPSLASVTTKPSLSPYHLATLNARTLTPSFPSYIPSEGFDPSFNNVSIKTYLHTEILSSTTSLTKNGDPCFIFPHNGDLLPSAGWH